MLYMPSEQMEGEMHEPNFFTVIEFTTSGNRFETDFYSLAIAKNHLDWLMPWPSTARVELRRGNRLIYAKANPSLFDRLLDRELAS